MSVFNIEKSEEAVPIQLNSLEFPPLPVRTNTEILMSASTVAETLTRGQATKRSLRHEEDEFVIENPHFFSAPSSESLSLSSLHPRKKSRIILDYREPVPVLLSADGDLLKSLFNSTTPSSSQNSDVGLWSSQSPEFVSPTQTTSTSCQNLESLGDIIQKYSNATLDSFKGFEIPVRDSVTAQSSPSCMLSPRTDTAQSSSICMLSPRTESRSKPLDANTSSRPENLAINLDNNYDDTKEPVKDESSSLQQSRCTENVIPSSNLMSLDLGLNTLFSDNFSNKSNSMSSSLDVDSGSQNQKNDSSISSSFPEKPAEMHQSHTVCPAPIARPVINTIADPVSADDQAHSMDLKFRAPVESSAKPISIERDGKEESEHKKDEGSETDDDDEEDSDDESEDNSPSGQAEKFEADEWEFKKCKKNPGHVKFYSPDTLKVRDLPPEIQNEDGLTCLTCLSQLVVQISAFSTSAARGPNDMYSEYIGTSRKRNGSGFIAAVDSSIKKSRCQKEDCPHAVYTEESNSSFEDGSSVSSPDYKRSASNMSIASTSSCSSSGSQGSKHFVYSGLNIRTNRHVIFDISEAQNAHVKFFFNTRDGIGVIHGHVTAIIGINNSQDHVILHVMSHDKNLFNIAELHLKNAKSSYNQMVASTGKMHAALSDRYDHSWVVVISHPHGLSKSITVGRIKKEVMDGTRIIKYYDAATCPGSSGGLVITPSLLRLQWPGAVHSCTDIRTGLNLTFDCRFQDLNYKDMDKINKKFLHKKKSCLDTYPDSMFKL